MTAQASAAAQTDHRVALAQHLDRAYERLDALQLFGAVDHQAQTRRAQRQLLVIGQELVHGRIERADMGGAVGLHLIMCTQLPIVEVIPKANMVLARSGALMNNDQSRVILDTGAAARLPNVKGRMVVRMHNRWWNSRRRASATRACASERKSRLGEWRGASSAGGMSRALCQRHCSRIRICHIAELQRILIATKRLELSRYRSARHLICGIVYDVEAARAGQGLPQLGDCA